MLEKALDAPKDIRNAILQLIFVPRFGDYKEGLFRDSTGAHVIRCIEMAKKLPLDEDMKLAIARYLWIHDIPEIIITDYTSLRKEDPEFARRLEIKEGEAARKLLSLQDNRLLIQFNAVGHLLRGKKDKNALPFREALLAKIIDLVDGNDFFNKELTFWINSSEYNQSDIPPETALTYTFRSFRTTYRSLSNLGLPERFYKVAKDLLIEELTQVVGYWQDVPMRRIPVVVQNELVWAKEALQKY